MKNKSNKTHAPLHKSNKTEVDKSRKAIIDHAKDNVGDRAIFNGGQAAEPEVFGSECYLMAEKREVHELQETESVPSDNETVPSGFGITTPWSRVLDGCDSTPVSRQIALKLDRLELIAKEMITHFLATKNPSAAQFFEEFSLVVKNDSQYHVKE